jgi:hypothetical protein
MCFSNVSIPFRLRPFVHFFGHVLKEERGLGTKASRPRRQRVELRPLPRGGRKKKKLRTKVPAEKALARRRNARSPTPTTRSFLGPTPPGDDGPRRSGPRWPGEAAATSRRELPQEERVLAAGLDRPGPRRPEPGPRPTCRASSTREREREALFPPEEERPRRRGPGQDLRSERRRRDR